MCIDELSLALLQLTPDLSRHATSAHTRSLLSCDVYKSQRECDCIDIIHGFINVLLNHTVFAWTQSSASTIVTILCEGCMVTAVIVFVAPA